MVEVDRVMVEELGIDLVRMMENAGRSLAELALGRFHPESVTVLVGPGGNGGGGLVAARHLANRGAAVTVVLVRPGLEGVPGEQLSIVERMGVPVRSDPPPADLVIDALIGYSLSGDPRGRAAALIRWALDQTFPVLALDTPSGLDVTSGAPAEPCIDATATLTLALPKTGLLDSDRVGELYLADISVPPAVYRRWGIEAGGLFSTGGVVRLR